ncbi:hypothetical protein SEMRO_1416_G270790.1 [Seminavis robusta]|uniref:Uncharacterized protein n=1 Tax=Seminavis robusta TaxID=568900 RepID=A0A9N8ENW3_9STRA|nr:hypothetical protein SEMRO_1416_G270790.1 [Seminavis robusta]|eukprot:Sro1416_g270790.1 n/a (197) ;mRNA; r:3120-3838
MDITRTGDSHLFAFYQLDLSTSIDEETKPKPSPATTRAIASLLSNLDMLVEVWDEDCTFLWRFKKNQYLTVEQGRKVGTHLSEKVADKDSRLVSFGFSPLSGRELVMKTDRGIEIVFILPAGQGRFVEPTGPGADPGAEKKKPHNKRRESSGTLEPWDERKEDADLVELVDLIGNQQISTRSTDTEYTYETVEDED